MIVCATSSDGPGFYQVPLDHPRLKALPLEILGRSSGGSGASDHERLLAMWDLFQTGELRGDQVYWVNTLAPPYGLLRFHFDDAEPERLQWPVPSGLDFIGSG